MKNRPLSFATALYLAFSAAAFAQTGPELLLKPIRPDTVWESAGDAAFLAPGHTGNGEDFQLNLFDYSGRFRERQDPFIPRLGWDFTYLDLSSDDLALQQDLVDISIAAAYELPPQSDWRIGIAAGIGYAGNSPFGESDAYYGMATLNIGRNLDEQTSLSFVVDYNGNRSIFPDLPLPGFAYRKVKDPTLTYVLGIPVSSIQWHPDKPINIEITWALVDSFTAKIDYDLTTRWRVYAEYNSRSEAFHTDGLSGNDRLLFQQRRAELGVQWRPFPHTRLTAAGGYAFGGEFSTGFDQRDSDLVADISDEPYVRLGFERRF